MPIAPLKMSYCQLCVKDFEARPCEQTWKRMIVALRTRGNIPTKVAIKACEDKYGKQFSSEGI